MRKRTDSRATSVKVEPGSVLGSVASASGQLRCSTSQPPESLRSEVDDTLVSDHHEVRSLRHPNYLKIVLKTEKK